MEDRYARILKLKGKIVVLYFCLLESPATKYEVEELNKLADRFRDSAGVVFIAIAREDRWTAKTFISETNFKFHVVPNSESLMKQYDIYFWPTHLVIDRNGIIRLHNRTYNPVMSVFWINSVVDKIIAEDK